MFVIQSCDNEEDIVNNQNVDIVQVGDSFVEKSIAEASKYVKLINNRYVWNMDKRTALHIGLSSEQIRQIELDIEAVNQQISIWEIQEAPYFLTDPESKSTILFNSNVPSEHNFSEVIRLKSGNSESGNMPSGTISTTGQSFGTNGGFAPVGARNAIYNCTARAAITPMYNVKLKNFGTEKATGGIGALGVISTFTLSLNASNASFEVSFATSDSNGGTCTWSLSN